MTNLERIKEVLEFYYDRGTNKESINELYRKILNGTRQKQRYYTRGQLRTI